MDVSSNSPSAKNNINKDPLNIRTRWLFVLAISFFIFLVWRYTVKSSITDPNKNKNSAVPVILAVARKADVPVYLPALGTVTPMDTVTVKTQINGQLLHVFFKEGQMVKKDQLLAEIDPRPYEAQLFQYEGQLARDKALLANAKLDLKRYETLYKQDSTSQQILDTQRSLVEQYEGDVKYDQGQIDSIKVSLVYCKITSPIDGRVGLRLVDPGNFVQTTDPGLFVINTIDPITVIFSIPEDDLPNVMHQTLSGKKLKTEVYDRAQNRLLVSGSLAVIDNQIDPTTGTIKLRSEFKNENSILFPNQFVNIKLLVDTLYNSTVVPTSAIQYGSKGSFVYILNNDKTVSVQSVSVRTTVGNYTAITSITPGQSVVIEGADKLKDGVTVNVLENKNHLIKGLNL